MTPQDPSAPAPLDAKPDSQQQRTSDAPQAADAPLDTDGVRNAILMALKSVYDPEIPVNICDLGLIYRVDVRPDGTAEIDMTLTAPNCPAAQELPAEVRTRAALTRGVRDVKLQIVWDPPWGPDRMSDVARIALGID